MLKKEFQIHHTSVRDRKAPLKWTHRVHMYNYMEQLKGCAFSTSVLTNV